MTLYTNGFQRATAPNSQDLKRRAAFAKAAVRLEFRGRDAKAVDQDAFVDRQPDQLPRRHTEADANGEIALDQFAKALRQVGGDTGLQP